MKFSVETIGKIAAQGRNYASMLVGFIGGVDEWNAFSSPAESVGGAMVQFAPRPLREDASRRSMALPRVDTPGARRYAAGKQRLRAAAAPAGAAPDALRAPVTAPAIGGRTFGFRLMSPLPNAFSSVR